MHTFTRFTPRHPKVIGAVALAATTVLGGAAYAHGPVSPASSAQVAAPASRVLPQANLGLTTSSPELEECFPKARAKVTVDLTTEERGKDTFRIRASGLQPRTAFTVFLLEKAGAPFGAAEYIGDFDTNRYGQGRGRFDLIVEEAFAFNNETQDRVDLNSVGIWFADPKDDDECLGTASPVTGFDGDAEAGVQMMNSGVQFLP
jgi:hypothetical protein